MDKPPTKTRKETLKSDPLTHYSVASCVLKVTLLSDKRVRWRLVTSHLGSLGWLGRIVEQRLPLAIGHRRRLSSPTEEDVAPRVLRQGDIERLGEEDGKDNNGKDPLQGDDLDAELLDGQCCRVVLALRRHFSQKTLC